MDIFQTALHIVQAIFAFAILVETAGDGNRAEFCWQEVLGILEGEAYFSQTAGTSGFTTVEDQSFEVFASQGGDLLLTNYPADGIHDIALTTSVGTNDAGDTLVEVDNCFVGKALEPLDF